MLKGFNSGVELEQVPSVVRKTVVSHVFGNLDFSRSGTSNRIRLSSPSLKKIGSGVLMKD